MGIDFSKAPEVATHYWVSDTGLLWYRPSENGPEVYNRGTDKWGPSGHRTLDMPQIKPIPTFEPSISAEDTVNSPRHYTTGSKHDAGKPLVGAVPPNALLAVARVLTFGAQKYGRDNWQQVEDAQTRYLDATLRHINAHQRGEKVDPESGESHLAHAVCSLMFMLELQS